MPKLMSQGPVATLGIWGFRLSNVLFLSFLRVRILRGRIFVYLEPLMMWHP